MHELSVCMSLLEQIQEIAAERGAARVARIELQIGPLSGVEADLLLNAWPIAAAGSIADKADINIEATDIVVRCSACDAETRASTNKLVCGACGDMRTALVSGNELILRRIELDAATG